MRHTGSARTVRSCFQMKPENEISNPVKINANGHDLEKVEKKERELYRNWMGSYDIWK
ncbi:MAG: hypothetical protein V8S84_09470 [Lachnospiraceae bacterium]